MHRRKVTALFPATALWLGALTGCPVSDAPRVDGPAVGPIASQQTLDPDASQDWAEPTVPLGSTAIEGDAATPEMAEAEEVQPLALEAEKASAADAAPHPPTKRMNDKGKRKSLRGAPGRSGVVGGALGFAGGGAWAPPPAPPMAEMNTEAYDHIDDNAFVAVADDPRSTFSIDVDTASYSNMRRFLQDGALPPADAVRIEEMINYFTYDYRAPTGSDPFSLTAETSECPWNEAHRLVHVGLQGKIIDQSAVPARNLVFLFDVSGSMNSPDKLPLLKTAFSLLVDNLRPEDKVSIVVYAGASGVVLEPTSGKHKGKILDALDRLAAGGATNGGEGILSAYAMAERAFVQGGINRVVLATDGDFNVGTTSEGDLVRLIEEKRRSGVFLSVLGFGRGNLGDSTMEKLADEGNGNYAYIDSVAEARKVLVEQAGATLVTIAKDVKIQVEFNPAEVASYRLIGYENRKLAHADFGDDTKDAGEIGAGHSVTALYEVVPVGASGGAAPAVDELKYQEGTTTLTPAASSGEMMTVKIRYKEPTGSTSRLLSFPIDDADASLADASRDFRFSAAVAGFGMLLRSSEHKGDASFEMVRKLADEAKGTDPHGRRAELVALIDTAARLSDGGTVR